MINVDVGAQGVMIPQTMMLACMRGMTGHMEQLGKIKQLTEEDVFLSFLPLAHIFGASFMNTDCTCHPFKASSCPTRCNRSKADVSTALCELKPFN